MNKENRCALCTHRSAHNGSCLVDNEGCKFKPNSYAELFKEELEEIKSNIAKQKDFHKDNEDTLYGINLALYIINSELIELN